jgi:hypothetical protein
MAATIVVIFLRVATEAIANHRLSAGAEIALAWRVHEVRTLITVLYRTGGITTIKRTVVAIVTLLLTGDKAISTDRLAPTLR